ARPESHARTSRHVKQREAAAAGLRREGTTVMTCEHFCELLPAYCEQRLTSRDMAFAREHLELCENCRADYEMWQKLSSLPQEEPSPESRYRYVHLIHAYEE